VNGYHRLRFAAQRNGSWEFGEDPVAKMMHTQEFVSNDRELLILVTYSGYTIKGAKLWDFSEPDCVCYQELTAHDRNKADRIEDVLLGNGRRF
jgi:hypothetical protein